MLLNMTRAKFARYYVLLELSGCGEVPAENIT
jgi:hypothetical protein